MRARGILTGLLLGLAACNVGREAVPRSSAPASDTQHQGITTPHGDHSPHHGGLVLMNGDLHYEVVLDPRGQHRLWFTDAVRQDLPASIARNVTMTVTRPNEAPERITLEIDDAGESWMARGRTVQGDGVMVKVNYNVRDAPHEVEIPFVVK